MVRYEDDEDDEYGGGGYEHEGADDEYDDREDGPEEREPPDLQAAENVMWVAPSHWRHIVGRDNRTMSASAVAEMRQGLYGRRLTRAEANEAVPGGGAKILGRYLRRGMDALEIMGGHSLEYLKDINAFRGSEEYLIQAVYRGTLSEGLTKAAMMAKSVGETLEEADFNRTYTTFEMPKEIRDIPMLEAKMSRLLARCKAMDIPVPNVMGLTAGQFIAAAEANEVMRDLTSDGPEWIAHFNWQDQRAMLGGLSAIEHVQGAAAGAAREAPRRPGGGASGSMNVQISEETPRGPGGKRWYFRFPLVWWRQETRGREWWAQAMALLLALMVTPFWVVGLLLRIVGFLLFTKDGRSCLEGLFRLAVFGAIIWAIVYLYQHC